MVRLRLDATVIPLDRVVPVETLTGLRCKARVLLPPRVKGPDEHGPLRVRCRRKDTLHEGVVWAVAWFDEENS